MKNERSAPKFYYGLHFQQGVAEYKDMPEAPMIYISGDTAKMMDLSFKGKPVFVLHEDNVDFENVQDADGMVIRSFFNKADGNHWAEFAVYTQRGIQAIEKNFWKLSNAYNVTQEKGSGSWHGVEYQKEVAMGEYEHLAIVPNPRYADSIILTPEEFKKYNEDKEAELLKLSNSKENEKMKLNFFKKTKVENSVDLEGMMIVLPKSKVEKSVLQLVNEADEAEEKKGYANMSDKVELENGSIMSVEELVNMCKKSSVENESEDELENAEDEDEKEVENAEDEKEEKEDEKQNKMKKNGKKKNSITVEEAEKEAVDAQKRFLALKNAHVKVDEKPARTLTLPEDRVNVGKQRYGSN